MGGMGEEKLYFPLLKSVKHQKAPLGRSISKAQNDGQQVAGHDDRQNIF